MAEYNPELRVRLQELDRELEVGCPPEASLCHRSQLLADDMARRRVTLPRRGKQHLLARNAGNGSGSGGKAAELTRTSQISEAADHVTIAVCSPSNNPSPGSSSVSRRLEHTLPRDLDAPFERWPTSLCHDHHDLRERRLWRRVRCWRRLPRPEQQLRRLYAASRLEL